MKSARRTLHYASFEEVMPDVERLLKGHTTVGNWSLAEICHHLSAVLRRHVDLPASTVFDPSDRVSEEQKQRILESGTLPAGISAPPGAGPESALALQDEVENLRAAIAYYQNAQGPVTSHRILGPLTKGEWDRFELIHLAHHLSFAVPDRQDDTDHETAPSGSTSA